MTATSLNDAAIAELIREDCTRTADRARVDGDVEALFLRVASSADRQTRPLPRPVHRSARRAPWLAAAGLVLVGGAVGIAELAEGQHSSSVATLAPAQPVAPAMLRLASSEPRRLALLPADLVAGRSVGEVVSPDWDRASLGGTRLLQIESAEFGRWQVTWKHRVHANDPGTDRDDFFWLGSMDDVPVAEGVPPQDLSDWGLELGAQHPAADAAVSLPPGWVAVSDLAFEAWMAPNLEPVSYVARTAKAAPQGPVTYRVDTYETAVSSDTVASTRDVLTARYGGVTVQITSPSGVVGWSADEREVSVGASLAGPDGVAVFGVVTVVVPDGQTPEAAVDLANAIAAQELVVTEM